MPNCIPKIPYLSQKKTLVLPPRTNFIFCTRLPLPQLEIVSSSISILKVNLLPFIATDGRSSSREYSPYTPTGSLDLRSETTSRKPKRKGRCQGWASLNHNFLKNLLKYTFSQVPVFNKDFLLS